jgi:hypothetical protein
MQVFVLVDYTLDNEIIQSQVNQYQVVFQKTFLFLFQIQNVVKKSFSSTSSSAFDMSS